MGLEVLAALKEKKRTIGTKQTMKAVDKNQAAIVFVAGNADRRVTEPLIDICQAKGITVETVESMDALGKACGVDVGTASAAVLKPE